MAEYNSKKFILEFFKDNDINDKNGIITVNNVSKDFEEFIGKKSPYKLVFDFNLHAKIKDSELVTQGSYFLIAIKDYLRNKGQTSLLKLNIEPDLSKLKKQFNISEIKFDSYQVLSEFSFLSVYQYLNEKKQTINKFLIRDCEILDLDLSEFKKREGIKDELPSMDLEGAYNLSRKKLNLQIKKEAIPIKSLLNSKLNKEISRIKGHYLKQIEEKDEEVEKCKEKIKLLESKLKHTFYERDVSILKRIIRESNARLEMLQKRSYRERLLAEEAFHVNDEVEKHVLSIKNVLINVTLFYYPIYSLIVSSKRKKVSKKYDPVLKKLI